MTPGELRELVTAIVKQVLAEQAVAEERPSALVLFTGALVGFEDALTSLTALSASADLDIIQTPSAQRILDQQAIARIGMTPVEQGLVCGHDMLIIASLTANLVGKVVNGIGDCMASNVTADFIMAGKPVIAARDAACPDSPGKRRWFPTLPEGYAAMMRENLTKLASFGVRLTSASTLDSVVMDAWTAPSEMVGFDAKVLSATDLRGLAPGTQLQIGAHTVITALAKEEAAAQGITILRRS